MNRCVFLSALCAAFALAGCFTVRETEYPQTAMTALGESVTNKTVVVRGFEATLTEVNTVYGYDTVYVPGYYGRHHYRHGHYATVRTATQFQQARETDAFLVQARDRMEAAGFNLNANPADYIVEARFTGPQCGSESVRALWWLCTLLLSDDAEQTWFAKLKIYDNRSGKLVFSRDYAQTYNATCLSPIPIFGPVAYERTSGNYMECWCLRALTDRVTADASAFLVAR